MFFLILNYFLKQKKTHYERCNQRYPNILSVRMSIMGKTSQWWICWISLHPPSQPIPRFEINWDKSPMITLTPDASRFNKPHHQHWLLHIASMQFHQYPKMGSWHVILTNSLWALPRTPHFPCTISRPILIGSFYQNLSICVFPDWSGVISQLDFHPTSLAFSHAEKESLLQLLI